MKEHDDLVAALEDWDTTLDPDKLMKIFDKLQIAYRTYKAVPKPLVLESCEAKDIVQPTVDPYNVPTGICWMGKCYRLPEGE